MIRDLRYIPAKNIYRRSPASISLYISFSFFFFYSSTALCSTACRRAIYFRRLISTNKRKNSIENCISETFVMFFWKTFRQYIYLNDKCIVARICTITRHLSYDKFQLGTVTQSTLTLAQPQQFPSARQSPQQRDECWCEWFLFGGRSGFPRTQTSESDPTF